MKTSLLLSIWYKNTMCVPGEGKKKKRAKPKKVTGLMLKKRTFAHNTPETFKKVSRTVHFEVAGPVMLPRTV